MNYSLSRMKAEDRLSVMSIFNYYVDHSFAAYREERLANEAFELYFLLPGKFPQYTIRDENDEVVGFGALRAHKDNPVFSHTAEILYFLHPDFCNAGIGKRLLAHLENEGQKMGITVLLANISSKNERSLYFHARNGFTECGRFEGIGRKNGETFDVIWMQKMISDETHPDPV